MSTLSSAGMSPGMHSTLTEVMICWRTPSLNSVTGGRLADRDERDLDRQLLAKVHRKEIDVHQLDGARADLQLADQHLADARPLEREVDEVAVAGADARPVAGCAPRSTGLLGSTLWP